MNNQIQEDMQKSSSYTPPEDKIIILDLLGEYSAKLREMIEIRKNHIQKLVLVLFTVSILLLFSMAAFFVSLSNSNSAYWSYSLLAFIIILAISLPYYYIRTQRHLKWTKKDLSLAQSELAKVIRTASQVEDHGGYKGYGLQLKAQLRLTEAESAMRLADDLLGTRNTHPYQQPEIQREPRASYSDLPASSNAS